MRAPNGIPAIWEVTAAVSAAAKEGTSANVMITDNACLIRTPLALADRINVMFAARSLQISQISEVH
jgi:hypothetical protein